MHRLTSRGSAVTSGSRVYKQLSPQSDHESYRDLIVGSSASLKKTIFLEAFVCLRLPPNPSLWGPTLGLLRQGEVSGSVCLSLHKPVSQVSMWPDLYSPGAGGPTRGAVPLWGRVAVG